MNAELRAALREAGASPEKADAARTMPPAALTEAVQKNSGGH